MSDFLESVVRAGVAGCLCWSVASCRDDASAPEGRPADPGAAPGVASASAARSGGTTPVGIGPSAVPASPSAAPVSPNAGASSAGAANGDCPGPSSASLPHFEQKRLASERPGQYRFELKYPLFHEDDQKVTPKLNRQLLEQLSAIQKRFLKEAQSEDRAPDPDSARWFEGKCETAYHSKSFVSVACDTMEGPGAHPNLDKLAYNFQLCPDVRLVDLADLCRSLPECRKKIVQLINEDFRAGDKKETGIQFRDGPGSGGEPPDMEHPVATLRTFGVTPAGLRIFLFDELPHVLQAFGVVDIPAAKLQAVLRDDWTRKLWGP